MPWQVPLHCCGHDLILTTTSSTFTSYSHLLSIHITHTLSLAENSLGNRSENCRLSLVTKSCLASVKAEHCDDIRVFSCVSATQASLWGKCVLP